MDRAGQDASVRLQGKRALITGAARGIGLAIARALVREGAALAIADIKVDAAQSAAASLRELGGPVVPIQVDVSSKLSVSSMVAAVLEALGGIDILINNAAVGGSAPFLETTLDDWQRIIGINLTGAFLVAQAVAREMVKIGGGKIVNITSISAQRGGNGRAAYGAAKAGLELLTKVMAVELSEHNINVNNIAPGAIETEMAKFVHDEATRAAYHRLIPLTRYGMPEDIADAAVFLCSEESRYVQGQTLNVDGGFQAAGLIFKPGIHPPRP
jgi:NAD(P)-dependent dehydrogenase (short-subunit alcohol dehydrogenase family)